MQKAECRNEMVTMMEDGSMEFRKGAEGYGAGMMAVICALVCLGALMVYSAGVSVDHQPDWRQFWKYATIRRVMFTPVVLIVLALSSRLNYRRCIVHDTDYRKSPVLYLTGLAIIMLGLVLIPGIGTEVNESRRWLKFGPREYGLTFQPSELAKWVIPMFLAGYCYFRGERIRDFWRGFAPAMGVLIVAAGLIGKEDFGTAFLLVGVGAIVLLIGGARWWHMLVLVPLAAVAFYFLVYCNDYRWSRVQAYLHGNDAGPEMASAYHAKQSVMTIASGGVWGVGLGQGTMKQGGVPEDTTDFIFAIIGEELGLVGCGIVIGLFALLVVQGVVIAMRSPDRLGKLLAMAVTTTIGAQAAMNMMVVTGLGPTKGIALPFVSAGGSGLVMTAMAAGVVVNVARKRKC